MFVLVLFSRWLSLLRLVVLPSLLGFTFCFSFPSGRLWGFFHQVWLHFYSFSLFPSYLLRPPSTFSFFPFLLPFWKHGGTAAAAAAAGGGGEGAAGGKERVGGEEGAVGGGLDVVQQLVRKLSGGEIFAERHHVTTDDGYLLTIHRLVLVLPPDSRLHNNRNLYYHQLQPTDPTSPLRLDDDGGGDSSSCSVDLHLLSSFSSLPMFDTWRSINARKSHMDRYLSSNAETTRKAVVAATVLSSYTTTGSIPIRRTRSLTCAGCCRPTTSKRVSCPELVVRQGLKTNPHKLGGGQRRSSSSSSSRVMDPPATSSTSFPYTLYSHSAHPRSSTYPTTCSLSTTTTTTTSSPSPLASLTTSSYSITGVLRHPCPRLILLQHGLLESSLIWIALGQRSLAFLLAYRGWQVWLGNNRGNEFSRRLGGQNSSLNHPEDNRIITSKEGIKTCGGTVRVPNTHSTTTSTHGTSRFLLTRDDDGEDEQLTNSKKLNGYNSKIESILRRFLFYTLATKNLQTRFFSTICQIITTSISSLFRRKNGTILLGSADTTTTSSSCSTTVSTSALRSPFSPTPPNIIESSGNHVNFNTSISRHVNFNDDDRINYHLSDEGSASHSIATVNPNGCNVRRGGLDGETQTTSGWRKRTENEGEENWSFEEMAKYDVPAILKYLVNFSTKEMGMVQRKKNYSSSNNPMPLSTTSMQSDGSSMFPTSMSSCGSHGSSPRYHHSYYDDGSSCSSSLCICGSFPSSHPPVVCIGQSQGAAQLLVGLSLLPHLSTHHVASVHLLAPPVVLNRPEDSYTMAVKFLMFFGKSCPKKALQAIRFLEWLIPSNILSYLADIVAGKYMRFYLSKICNRDRINIFKNIPSGSTSTKNLRHWMQILSHGGIIGTYVENEADQESDSDIAPAVENAGTVGRRESRNRKASGRRRPSSSRRTTGCSMGNDIIITKKETITTPLHPPGSGPNSTGPIRLDGANTSGKNSPDINHDNNSIITINNSTDMMKNGGNPRTRSSHCSIRAACRKAKSTPYPLERIRCPLRVYYGTGDNLVNVAQSIKVLDRCFGATRCLVSQYEGWGHVDFGWGSNRWRDFYPDMIRQCEQDWQTCQQSKPWH